MIGGFALGGGPPFPSYDDLIQIIASFMIVIGILIFLYAWWKVAKKKG